jgi:hypothetical protein
MFNGQKVAFQYLSNTPPSYNSYRGTIENINRDNGTITVRLSENESRVFFIDQIHEFHTLYE